MVCHMYWMICQMTPLLLLPPFFFFCCLPSFFFYPCSPTPTPFNSSLVEHRRNQKGTPNPHLLIQTLLPLPHFPLWTTDFPVWPLLCYCKYWPIQVLIKWTWYLWHWSPPKFSQSKRWHICSLEKWAWPIYHPYHCFFTFHSPSSAQKA